MKEVTYEDWQKNPTPRMMWVWDSIENNKRQRKVIYFLDSKLPHPLVALTEDKVGIEQFRHCAEIEELKTRRMTNKELARWIREKPTREWKYKDGTSVYGYYVYEEKCENEEVLNNILIREDDGEWREPLGVKSQLLRSKL